jgi:hypothetical protein
MKDYSAFLIASALLGLLISPAMLHKMQSQMIWHMGIQIPLIILCGALLIHPWRIVIKSLLSFMDYAGVFSWLSVSGILVIWMLPISLDLAVSSESINIIKIISLLFAGAILNATLNSSHMIVQYFFTINIAWMTIVVGILYQEMPSRLCNAYLLDDQVTAGIVLVGWGALIMAYLAVKYFLYARQSIV